MRWFNLEHSIIGILRKQWKKTSKGYFRKRYPHVHVTPTGMMYTKADDLLKDKGVRKILNQIARLPVGAEEDSFGRFCILTERKNK